MDSEDVQQFAGITGASARTAAHYLEQAGGDLQEAIEQYYAAGGKEAPAEAGPAAAAAGQGGGDGSGRAAGGGGGRRVPSGGNIRGFADLGGDEESEEDADEDNEYYAGGAKRCAPNGGGDKRGAGGPGFRVLQLMLMHASLCALYGMRRAPRLCLTCPGPGRAAVAWRSVAGPRCATALGCGVLQLRACVPCMHESSLPLPWASGGPRSPAGTAPGQQGTAVEKGAASALAYVLAGGRARPRGRPV